MLTHIVGYIAIDILDIVFQIGRVYHEGKLISSLLGRFDK